MRVLQIIDVLYEGGAQNLLLTFAGEICKRGVNLSVVCLTAPSGSPYPERLRSMGVDVNFFPVRRLFDVGVLFKLVGWLMREKPDVIHAHLTYSNILGTVVGRLTGIPVVVTLHTIGTEPRFYAPKTDWSERLALQYGTSRVIACGPAVAAVYERKLGGKMIDVIPNAIPLDVPGFTAAERFNLRTQIMGDPNRTLILSVGRLVPPKAFHDLLEAVSIVRLTCPNVYLAIAGDGELRDALEKQAIDAELEDFVCFLGTRNDISSLLASSDMFVLSSKWEGLPLVVLEAMRAALPIVATDVGDVAWALGPAGLVVPPSQPKVLADGIIRLITKPANELQVMGDAAYNRVKDVFDVKPWVDEILSLYEELI